MFTPYTYAAGRLAEERRNDTMRQGELGHLLRHAKPARFGLRDRLVAQVGGLMISVGDRLRERCALFRTTAGAGAWQPPVPQRR